MSDITKCKGKKCPIRDTCYRYTCDANLLWQSYFVESPYKNGNCNNYWPNDKKEQSRASKYA